MQMLCTGGKNNANSPQYLKLNVKYIKQSNATSTLLP